MSEQLSKIYEPKKLEKHAQEIWIKGNYFHPDAASKDDNNFAIVIPPPNVTAALHLGHALNNTLQDILVRFRRMQQKNTLWMPGTDHAGIATQTVVEKRILTEENKRRTDFEREEFVARVQAWKDLYEARILEQLKAMGCSCDWDRMRFTMDDICARAVRAAFFKLFKDGLIYRGKRLVNWDPATQTVLADDEVEHETIQGFFWYLQYPLEKPVEISGEIITHVTVATTRPETMLGDTAVAMNPADPRAEFLTGKNVLLPLVGRLIPIITDEHVVLPDPDSCDEKAKFSTGFLKVTPAHDPDDWEIGLRHDLGVINIMAPDGSISDKYGFEDVKGSDAEFVLGMDRFEAREAIVEWFRTENLLENIREYAHEVGHSYRSHVPIEPYLSDQWYIAVKKPIEHLAEQFGAGFIEGTDLPVNSLAGLALKPLVDHRLRFIPERYNNTYKHWLENLRDWPISRQLWWGHRIPVWKSSDITKLHPEISAEKAKSLCETAVTITIEGVEIQCRFNFDDEQRIIEYVCVPGGNPHIENHLEQLGFERDPDVLDTWFSSALWPFSTMGWPEQTAELKAFYPGNVLCTAREIITLWVSRMVMMGQYCVGDIPFSDVFIHAMIQDGQGRKMSKSLGNGIDPLVAIDSHGADAMRFTLASMTTETQDVRMPVELMELPDGRKVNTSGKFDIGRNFCNKLWNASRFAMMNLDNTDPAAFDKDKLDITDKWILSRLAKAAQQTTQTLEEFKFSEPINNLYKFFWNDFCDWYLEWSKPRMKNDSNSATAKNVLAFVLDNILRLLHPFVPFITEVIFQKLNEIVPSRRLEGLTQACDCDALVIADWPDTDSIQSFINEKTESDIDTIQNVIRTIRDIRSKYNRKPAEKMTASASTPADTAEYLNRNSGLVCQLAGLNEFKAALGAPKPENSAAAVIDQMQIYLHNAVDVEAEKQRLEKQKEQIAKAKNATDAKLANENFVNKAKPEVVQQAKQKLAQLTEQLDIIDKHLSELKP